MLGYLDVTTGRGCTITLGACESYTGDDVACGGLKGTDGNCEGVPNGTKCKARTCAGAAATLTTRTDCAAYQTGCVTNGKGCVTAPLPDCASYSGDNTTCVGYIGSDGTCEGDAGATNCRARVCTNAPTSNNTNTLCAAYKPGCVTTGKGCIAIKGACSSYSGTTTSCVGYIGTDGYCKGTNATTAFPCAPKVCTEAPTTTNTNAACASYQTGCVTTGKGCVSSLGPCSGYIGTTNTCDGYVGTDGKCKGTNATTAAACAPKVCTEAPASTTTNEACAQYQTGCVTNGAGCVSLTSCINTIKQISCTGTPSCGWNNICVASANCSDFLTVSICLGNTAGTGASSKPCFWTGSACRDLACTDAPTTHNTDTLCNTFLSGCWTKGNGCLAQSAPCSSYQGTQTTCAAFAKKCWNISAAISTTACKDRTCADDTTSTSDSACNTFKTGCRTKGTGCIDASKQCQDYQGTNVGIHPFTTSCTIKQCSDNQIAKTDMECEAFLSGCVTNTQGCISKSLPCKSYYCEQYQCQFVKGINGTTACWFENSNGLGNCIDRQCSHAPTNLISTIQCQQFLSGCIYNGFNCVSSNKTCSSYSGTYDECVKFKEGDDQNCSKEDACSERTCADLEKAESQQECQTYLSTCTYFKGRCVTGRPCNQYLGASLTDCQYLLDNSFPPKQCWWIDGFVCTDRDCNKAPTTVSNQSDCHEYLKGCYYDGQNSCLSIGNCEKYQAKGVDDLERLNYCKQISDSSHNLCWYYSGTNYCISRTCLNAQNPKSGLLNCQDHLPSCSFNGDHCVDKGNCSSYQVSGTDQERLAKCKAMQNSVNQYCFWESGDYCDDIKCSNAHDPKNQEDCDTHLKSACFFKVENSLNKCINKTCENIPMSFTEFDCQLWLSTCIYNGTTCVTQGSCSSYKPTGSTFQEKSKYCSTVKDLSMVNCTYIDEAQTCTDKTCENFQPVTQLGCVSWNKKCKWINSKCIDTTSCTGIDAQGTQDSEKLNFCNNIRDNSNIVCTFKPKISSTKCLGNPCSLAVVPSNFQDCFSQSSNCRFTNTHPPSCIEKALPCSEYTGTASQCKEFRGINDTQPCWSVSTSTNPEQCIDRVCSHNVTAKTDIECEKFLSGCKTNGKGCVSITVPCVELFGTPSTCYSRKSIDGKNYCKSGLSISGPCISKTCYDNISSTTDSQCEAYMSNCVTKGTGCIPKAEPCSSYTGTQQTCALFRGSNGTQKCWNAINAIASTACLEFACSSDTTSTSDAECAYHSSDCITKGKGCIEKMAPCSSYNGDQKTCAKFRGNNGTVYCWNVPTIQFANACIEKQCSHNSVATTDADCDYFLPKGKCVTNGQGCVPYPRKCSEFEGTTDQCSNFTASDGPCKSTVTTGSGPCTPRICTEALNTNNTDAFCKVYHPTCVTTGYGCATSVTCSNLQEQSSCTSKAGCSWVYNCRSIETDCSALTTSGASICVNTQIRFKQCAWYNNTCRTVTCEDLSDSLKTDQDCRAQNYKCTTKGDGCITKAACSTYSTETICKAARTTDVGDTCIWDSNACRAKKCTDATIGTTTNNGCNTFLYRCKTNGKTCISPGFNCTSIITKAACLQDGSYKPCLWVNGVCYNYVKCEDITMTTHSACQAFSPLCTTDGTKCIAISSCSKTSLQASCIKGTDGTCGWFPANGANAAKCLKFGACSDAVSADKATCQAYGSTCITDGNKCIDIGTCSTYTTQIACKTGGTDGTCIFFSNACRLRECTDATTTNATAITTHAGCYSFSAKTKCTTNGNSCISLSTCSSYTIEGGCERGTDGICTWALPVGTTTTTAKSCRLKVCQDFTLTTSATCSTALTGAGAGTGCVSNGTNCIVKSTCETYTTKEACNGGGTDGLCAFTPGSTTVGTCKVMSQCSDANNDRLACAAKSAVCNWKVTTSGTTTTSACNDHDCTTKASRTDCNPVPSFDAKTYSICIPSKTGTGCVLGDGASLTQASCQQDSLGTYTWNASTNLCTACFTRSSIVSDDSTTSDSPILVIALISLLIV